jgi:hypothetical protein
VFLIIAGLILAMAVLAMQVDKMPYLPSHPLELLFRWIVPPVLYVASLVFFFTPIRGRTFYSGVKSFACSGGYSPSLTAVCVILSLGAWSFGLGWMCEALFVWPTMFLSHPVTSSVVHVSSISTLGNTLGRWSRIAVTDAEGHTAEFGWRSADLASRHLREGDKLRITGPTWRFGTYIDSWEVTD